jgi:asparagine synthetase B (glutamine-hydrolysing)
MDNINESMEKSFYVSSKKIGLHPEAEYNGFYLGFHQGCTDIDTSGDSITVSVEEAAVKKAGHGLKSNYITIEKGKITIAGSDMNTQAIYYIDLPREGVFVVFNDLLMAGSIMEKLGLKVEYDGAKKGTDLSWFNYVNRLKYSEKIIVNTEGDAFHTKVCQGSNILIQAPAGYSLDEAKERFYKALFNATQELTAEEDEVFISLSGGIDSGTIAYILTQLNKKVNAYTLGTDWGNEYEQAQETADFLGINLKRIHISKEEIINEVPNVIRFFGFKESVQIEIALVAFCLHKKLYLDCPKNRTFVTGYGSDLLNAGIYSSFNEYSELADELIRGLRKTQISNEFNNLAALNFGVKNIHPFWHSEVIREALRVPAEYKVMDGIDKFFFRSMMADRLPASIAWRTKRGAHQGSGLNESLKKALEANYGERDGQKLDHKEILENIHKDIFLNGNYPWKYNNSVK